MIRPFAVLTAALALGSGFYLYQAKHRTQLLDVRISAVEQRTASAESRISVLRAEWALENAPSRLADLAAHYLLLVPMAPAQAVSMHNLASRLPAPVEPGAAPPAASGPDLVATANLRLLARYASLDYFADSTTRTAASPAVVAQVPAPPPTPVIADVQHTPPALAIVAARHAPPAIPSSLARLSPPTEGAPAPAGPTPTPPPPLHTRPIPILTSALGGSYPALPPPAPLSGLH